MACTPDDALPVVARGKYIDLATERDEPICGGTVALLDGLVEEGFAFLGEPPPGDLRIRYEWLPEPDEPTSLIGTGSTRRLGDEILIRTDQLVEEHELAHAVHASARPVSARYVR